MNPLHLVRAYQLKKYLELQEKIVAHGGTSPAWLTQKIAELEAES